MSVGRTLRRQGPVVGGLLVVFALGIGLGSVVIPPLLDRLVPLESGTALGPTPAPSPSGPDVMLMNGVAISAKADCAGCHSSTSGALANTNPPPLAHPLEGWAQCTECHADGRLVPLARGHENIASDQCLACHQEQGKGNAPTRPHHVYEGQDCTSCHNGTKAPLPDQMSARNACWLCHHDVPGASLRPEPAESAAP